MILQLIPYVVVAYLLGSVPFGKVIAKRVAHVDITQRGSGNIGATNVARELNAKWGILTLVLDVLKGLAPVVVFAYCASQENHGYETGLCAVGLAALLGHQFSLFLGFRGGKGVATALGVYLGISPLSCLLALILFFLIVYKWDFISLGSMVSVSSMPLFLALFGKPLPLVVGSFVMAALICLKHRENIQRLVRGKERKWSHRKNQEKRSKSLSNSSSE